MVMPYYEFGKKDAPLIVFLHAGGVSGWMWKEQVRYFQKGFHCVVPDLPEHGVNQSSKHFTIQDSVLELKEIIKTTAGGQPVILVGFSLGAQVIIQLLSQYPDLADYAMINSAAVRPDEKAMKLLPVIGLAQPLARKEWFAKLQAKSMYIPEEDFPRYFEESAQLSKETLLRVTTASMAFALPADFRRARAKILVTVGEKEREMMKHSARDLVTVNPHSLGIRIPGVGHGLSLAKPKYFNRLLEGWLRDGEVPSGSTIIMPIGKG